jgi:hypothetical protein
VKRLVVFLAALVTLGGCGIGSGQVIADGLAPKDGPGGVTGISGPPKRSGFKNIQPGDLVTAFLQASAANPADPAARELLMRTYVVGAEWRPTGELKVVHIVNPDVRQATVNNADGTYTVNLLLQHVGVLDDDGVLAASDDEGTEEVRFTVVNSGGELMLRDPPREFLLSDAGLGTYFEARPLYFYNGGTLVPDLRYVSQSLSQEQKSNKLVDWLYDGAAAWLAPSVRRLPPDTRPGVTKAVRGENGSLVIDLSASVGDAEFRQLREQLARTLIRAPLSSLTIKVQGQVKAANYTPTFIPDRSTPARYLVADGVVHRLRTLGRESSAAPLPAEVNKNVVAAAFSAGEGAFAVVQQDGASQRLLVGTRTPVTVNLHASHVAQPYWLDHESRSLLVQADEHIYQIGVDGKIEQDTQVPGLQAMSTFYDGRRLALVIGGKLYLVSRSESGTIAVGLMQVVRTQFDAVQGVAFGERSQLVVSGSLAGGVRLLRMNLDGSQQILLGDAWQGTVSHIVADQESGNALFEVQGRGAFEAGSSSQSLYEGIDWSPAAGPPAEKARISAPSFEG